MRFGFREFIFLIVLLAVPAVSLFYVFQPRNREIRQALAEMQVKQTRLDRLERHHARLYHMRGKARMQLDGPVPKAPGQPGPGRELIERNEGEALG